MKTANYLTAAALCLALLATTTLPGCKRRVEPAPEPDVVVPEPETTPEPTPVVVDDVPPPPVEPGTPFDTSLVVKANELEAQLEGRLLWEAARKCKAREFASDTEARDWLKERWRKCEKKAAADLEAEEQRVMGRKPDQSIESWLDTAAEVWAAEAQASDPSLKGKSL